jgi:hypothetical protein
VNPNSQDQSDSWPQRLPSGIVCSGMHAAGRLPFAGAGRLVTTHCPRADPASAASRDRRRHKDGSSLWRIGVPLPQPYQKKVIVGSRLAVGAPAPAPAPTAAAAAAAPSTRSGCPRPWHACQFVISGGTAAEKPMASLCTISPRGPRAGAYVSAGGKLQVARNPEDFWPPLSLLARTMVLCGILILYYM